MWDCFCACSSHEPCMNVRTHFSPLPRNLSPTQRRALNVFVNCHRNPRPRQSKKSSSEDADELSSSSSSPPLPLSSVGFLAGAAGVRFALSAAAISDADMATAWLSTTVKWASALSSPPSLPSLLSPGDAAAVPFDDCGCFPSALAASAANRFAYSLRHQKNTSIARG